jgi:hypothetical protein
MGLPPSVKVTFPSLQINNDRGIATLSFADVKRQLPSLTIKGEGRDLPDALTITLSAEDLRKLLRIALAGVTVDDKWYAAQIPGLVDDLKAGAFKSATEHYYLHGYLEGRPPENPTIDEDYYLKTYPDIAQAVKSGKLKSAHQHYLMAGYAEGRSASPPPARKK